MKVKHIYKSTPNTWEAVVEEGFFPFRSRYYVFKAEGEYRWRRLDTGVFLPVSTHDKLKAAISVMEYKEFKSKHAKEVATENRKIQEKLLNNLFTTTTKTVITKKKPKENSKPKRNK